MIIQWEVLELATQQGTWLREMLTWKEMLKLLVEEHSQEEIQSAWWRGNIEYRKVTREQKV